MTPRMHLTTRVADGVELTYMAHAIAMGLNYPESLHFEPSNEEPVVLPATDVL
jgi:hypothetical protein